MGGMNGMRNSVALNTALTSTTNSSSIGRVYGDGTASINNYAQNGMTVNSTGYTPDPTGVNGKDGADVTTSDYNNETWWRTVPGSGTNVGWDLDTIWMWDTGVTNLPVMRIP
jgi:hypothetical protein